SVNFNHFASLIKSSCCIERDRSHRTATVIPARKYQGDIGCSHTGELEGENETQTEPFSAGPLALRGERQLATKYFGGGGWWRVPAVRAARSGCDVGQRRRSDQCRRCDRRLG